MFLRRSFIIVYLTDYQIANGVLLYKFMFEVGFLGSEQ